MRRVRYVVVTSLDGYIAGPNGEADWIVTDPDVDFGELFNQFETALVGRKTFEAMVKAGRTSMPGIRFFVFSRTLRQEEYPQVTIVAEQAKEVVTQLREKPGKDIWLFGGGALFSSLASEGLVDTVELAVMPVLLGNGLPVAPNLAHQINLTLTGHKLYKKT